ncbi:MAG TPA: tetratricopeptide repeat protein [bacterium]|nr:tetratricopeptide repeat protein [bacterium]
MTAINQSVAGRTLLFTAVAVCWCVLMTFPIESFDFYYHLATGRWIAEHYEIPTHDVFSATARGTSWVTHEWAAQLGMYIKYRMGGIPYLLMMKSLWLTGAGLLLFALGNRLKSPPLWTALLLTAAAPAVAFRAFIRPHVISYGFLVLLLYMIYSGRPSVPRHRLVALAVLFMVWANCHSGFVFGLFVLTGWEFVEAVRSRRRVWKHVLPVAVAAVAALINPNTWHVYLYPFRFISHPELFTLISELRPLTTPSFQGGWFIPLFYGLLIIAAAFFLLRVHRGAVFELMLLIVFGAWAFQSVRNVPLATIVLLPGLFRHGGALWEKWLSGRSFRRIRGIVFAGVLALPLFLTYTALTDGIPVDGKTRRHFGIGVSGLNYPSGAVQYLRDHPIEGTMFNTFAFGGYLLWELYPDPGVFIDGRLFVYLGQVMDDYRRVIAGDLSLDDLATRYGVSHLVLAYPDMPGSERRGMYQTLKTTADWVPVYWDDNAMIFLRDGAQNARMVAEDGYRFIHPLRRKLRDIDETVRRDPDAAFREAERALETTPENTAAMTVLARYYAFRGDDDRSLEAYRKILDIRPENHLLRRQYALHLMQINAYVEAEAQWRRVIGDGGGDGFARQNYGICLHRLKQNDAAMEQYQISYRSGYRSAELMNVMGIYNAQNGKMNEAVRYWKRGLEIDPDHVQLKNNLARASAMTETK